MLVARKSENALYNREVALENGEPQSFLNLSSIIITHMIRLNLFLFPTHSFWVGQVVVQTIENAALVLLGSMFAPILPLFGVAANLMVSHPSHFHVLDRLNKSLFFNSIFSRIYSNIVIRSNVYQIGIV